MPGGTYWFCGGGAGADWTDEGGGPPDRWAS